MREITDWNGHHVLAVPVGTIPEQDTVSKAYAEAVWSLAYDLGVQAESRSCRLCPMLNVGVESASHRCTHPRGLMWAATRGVDQGGCAMKGVIAEEYIPLVKMRLGEQT